MTMSEAVARYTLALIAVAMLAFIGYIIDIMTTAEEGKPNPIRNEKLTIVEDTLNPNDSRIVSRVTVNKQKFIIFKLGRNYYAFEEQK